MTHFLNKVLGELKSNKKLNSNPLVKMLVESTDKSIALGENPHKVYTDLKKGLYSINEQVKLDALKPLIGQIKKAETTPEAMVEAIAKEVNLKSKIKSLKESITYTNPIVKGELDIFEAKLDGGAPEFYLCPQFISILEKHSYDKTFSKVLDETIKYVETNEAKLHMLYAIYEMDSVNSPIYAGVSNSLKEMLINKQYTADSLKLKYGNSIPLITNLVSNLRLIESKKTGAFTLLEGNGDTEVNNLVAPMLSTKDGMIIYLDNRFLSIRESKGLLGYESNIHINSNYKIAELDPNYIRKNLSSFYSICEAYATLGFTKTQDGLGVESKSLRNIKIGLKLNEKRALDLYVNDKKADSSKEAQQTIAFATSLQTVQNKQLINLVLENSNKVFNFEFIKTLTNHRLGKEIMVAKLNNDYFVCEKLNQVEHSWKKMTPNQLYTYVKEAFSYDIRPVFGEKISESEVKINKIESRKKDIIVEVGKLEESVEKLKVATQNKDLDFDGVKKLDKIRESIESMINTLKEEYVAIDLVKQEI
jgi:hypothetical protein